MDDRDSPRRTAARIARTLRERCRECWTKLAHSGYIAPGGVPVILSTCPICDRYREED